MIVIGSDGSENITLDSNLVATSAPRGVQEGVLGSAPYQERADLVREPNDDLDDPESE